MLLKKKSIGIARLIRLFYEKKKRKSVLKVSRVPDPAPPAGDPAAHFTDMASNGRDPALSV